jgi:hypothetical protein
MNPRLIAGPGDTLWVFYTVDRFYPDSVELVARWGMGDSWSEPEVIYRNPTLYNPGVGVDPQGRIWLAWYNGDYPIDPVLEDTWGIWISVRDSGVWSEPALAIRGPDPQLMRYPAGFSFAADREGNWYMGIEENWGSLPDGHESAMYSRLDGDTWTWPRYIEKGWGSPAYVDCFLPTLAPHPDSGLWSVHDYRNMSTSQVRINWVVNDTVYEVGSMEPNSLHEAVADSAGTLLIASRDELDLWCTFCDGHGLSSEGVSEDLCARPFYPQICYDSLDWIWVGWATADTTPVVSYRYPGGPWWSDPEPVADSNAVLLDLTADSEGRLCALFHTWGNWYTTYRQIRPGVNEGAELKAEGKRPHKSILRGPELARLDCRVIDALGRDVTDRRDRLAPGVYFIGEGSRRQGFEGSRVKKVIVQR